MDERPYVRQRSRRGLGLVAMNVSVSRIALKVARLAVEAPHPELGTAESQLKSIIAALEHRLIMSPLGKQSGEHQGERRDGQQRRSGSISAVGQAWDLTQLTRAEGGCPDDCATEDKCRGSSKHRPAARSQQRW